MPQVFTEIGTHEIIEALRKRGYGIDSCKGYAFRIAVRSRTKISKTSGLGFFEPIGGPTEAQLREIKQTSVDLAHAVSRVEALAKGTVQEVRETAAPGGVDVQAILYAVDNRIESKLSAALAPVNEALAAISKMLTAPTQSATVPQEAPLAAEPEFDESKMLPPLVEMPNLPPEPAPKKKPGWPKGKPRKKATAE